jgi:CheY-like chemotaxis protein
MLQRVVGEHVVIETEILPETHHVHMDAVEIEQVLLNLCVNARDAMPEGGRIRISTANVTLRARDVTHRQGVQPGEFVAVSVIDGGCGMDEKTKARIFEPFFTTKDLNKGTGMGLATVYGIVQRSRGFIEVDSEPGRGTCFTIYLPRASVGIAPRQVTDRPEVDPRGTETILVVEDEEVLRNLVRRILEVHGYTVITVNSGDEACQVLEQQKVEPDLVLSDVVMPGLSGVNLARRLQDRGSKLPVLLMSGYPDLADEQPAAIAGEILCKPFTSEMLVRAVRQALNSSPVRRPS